MQLTTQQRKKRMSEVRHELASYLGLPLANFRKLGATKLRINYAPLRQQAEEANVPLPRYVQREVQHVFRRIGDWTLGFEIVAESYPKNSMDIRLVLFRTGW